MNRYRITYLNDNCGAYGWEYVSAETAEAAKRDAHLKCPLGPSGLVRVEEVDVPTAEQKSLATAIRARCGAVHSNMDSGRYQALSPEFLADQEKMLATALEEIHTLQEVSI